MVQFLPASDAAAVAATWRSLERELRSDSVACSWDWTDCWLEAFGDVVPHRFAVAAVDEKVVGIALVCEAAEQRRKPLRVRRAHVGTAGEPRGQGVYVEYNRLLAAPDYSAEFARALIDRLRKERFDEIALDGFADADLRPFLAADQSMAMDHSPAPKMRLGEARDGDVLSALSSGARQRVRRSLRGFGPIETEWAATPAAALDILDELIALHQRRWTSAGEPGVFASARFSGFHRALVPRLVVDGRALLFRAHAAGRTIGCLYSIVEGDRVLFYQSGFAAPDDPRLKPGLVTHALCMQACLARGFAEYNFLAGEARYKRELSTDEDELVWAVSRRPRALAPWVERRLVGLVRGVRAVRRRSRAAAPL